MNSKVSVVSVGSLALAFSLSCGATAAFATPHVFEGDSETTKVCAVPEGTIKVESPTAEQLVVVAPEGFEIDKICVKAGSDKQGDGVSWIYGNGATTITVTHPSGKDVSHFVAYFKPKVVTPPADQPINGPLPVPVFMDYCGTENDDALLPKDHGLPITYVRVDHDTVKAVANPGHVFAEGLVTVWDFEFNTNPCPVFIVVEPEKPVVCEGQIVLPADTDQYYYGMDGFNVYVIPKDGHLFVQDIASPGKDHIVWPIESLTEVCVTDVPVEEEPPAVVTPPKTDTPPAVDVPPATDVPPAVVVPPVQNVTPVIDVPVVPASTHVEPTDDVDQISAAVPYQGDLPHTGPIDLIVAGTLAALLIMSGLWMRFGNRLSAAFKK